MFDFLHISVWGALFALLAGYLIGSIPTGVLVAHLFRAPDPRVTGSTHTGASNVFRSAGPVAGALTGAFDFAKGALAVWLVQLIFPSPWVVPLTGAAAVAGHCWPIFTNFHGGMGVATAAGLAVWQFSIALPIFAVAYLVVNYVMKHQARTMMLTSAFLPLMLFPFRPTPEKMALAASLAVILVIRWASDFHRVYD